MSSMVLLKTERTLAILLVTMFVVVLIAAGVSAVSAQESDDAPPSVSVRQSDNATSTPITIDPPDSDDGATGQTNQPPDPPRNLTAAVLGQKALSVDWEAPANDGGGPITSYDLSYGPVGESPTLVSVSDLYKIVTGLRPGTRYEFRVSARNSAGSSSWVETFATTEEPDDGVTGRDPDTDITISGLSSMIVRGSSDRFTVVAELEIGSHTLRVSASGGVGFNSTCSGPPPSQNVDNDGSNLVDHMYYWSVTLHACGCSGGTVTASVSGESYESDSQSVTVVNSSPTVTIDTSSQTVSGGASVSLDATASDPENNNLTHSWSGSGLFADSFSLDTTWTAPAAQSTSRTYPLEVTVSDGCLTDTASVSMTVTPPPPTPTPTPTGTMSISVNTTARSITVDFSSTADDYSSTDSHTYDLLRSDTQSGTFTSESSTTVRAPTNESESGPRDPSSHTFQNVREGWYKVCGGRTDYPDERACSSTVEMPPDTLPTLNVSFSESSYTVEEGSLSPATITVNMSPKADRQVAILVRVTNGSAESDDYAVSDLTAGRLSFTSGDSSMSFTIQGLQDEDCDDETVNISFGGLPPGVNVGSPSSSSLQIDDDDPPCPIPTAPSVNISPVSGQPVAGGTRHSLTASVGGYPVPTVLWEGQGDFDDAFSANTDWTAPPEQQHEVDYELMLTAENTEGEDSASITVAVRAIPGPAAPSLSSPNITSNSVQLHWNTPDTLGNGAVTFVGIRYRMVGAAQYTWFGSFRVEDASAVVGGLEESTMYEFQIFARNVNGGRSDYTTQFATTATTPNLTPTCPSIGNKTGDVDQYFEMMFNAATGGDGTLTHSVSDLPIPLLLELNNGVYTISGTPTTAETISVVYQATDDDGDSCSVEFDIVIDPEPPNLTPTCPSIGNESGEVNQLFEMTFSAATGGDGTLTHFVSGLPSTLSYSLSNGVFTISGTPTTAETIRVEYEATDSDGDSCGDDFDIVIEPVSNRLSASPPTIRIGETTTLEASDVSPSGTQVKLVYDTKLTHLASCPQVRARSSHNTIALSPPDYSATLIGCWPGTANVSLRTVSGDVELDSVDITIVTPSLSISGLVSSLEQGHSDTFDVVVSGVSSRVTYSIEMLAGDSDLSFSSACNNTDASKSLSGSTSYREGFTLYGCNVGGAAVFASLLHGTRTIDTDNIMFVTVTNPALPIAPAPSSITATVVPTTTIDKQVKVTWATVPNVTNYRVRWHELLDGTGISTNEDTTMQDTYTVTGLACGQEYDFDVAGRGNGINHQDDWGSVATVSNVPSEECTTGPHTPTNITRELGPRKGYVTLSWTNVTGATEYKVRQRAFGGSWNELPSGTTTINFSIGNTKTTAEIGGLTHRVPYEWQVQAVNQISNETSPWSDGVFIEIPVCTATSLGDADHGLTSPTIINKSGDWNHVCYSERFPDTLAQYFQFTLDDEAHVTVDLVSADANAYIALRQGAAMTSMVYSSNDNNGESTPGSTTNARVAMRLDSGTYTIEATMNELGPTKGKFSVLLRSVEPLPAIGHQKDHTSVYVVDSLPTPLPSPANAHDPPDPAVVFPTAIAYAVDAWGDAVSGSWPNVVICERDSSGCNSRNDDRQTTTLKVGNCGVSTACVEGPFGSHPDDHVPSMTMIIEEPAWSGETKRVYWTVHNVGQQELAPGPNGESRVLWYLPGVLMHEFGHTIGLTDLGGRSVYYNGYVWSIMARNAYDFDSIPDKDEDYVEQVYRNRHGARPH